MGSSGDPRWLDADEAEAWRALVSVLYTLPQALDADMQYHAGMTLYDYLVMAALSETPDRAIRLSEIGDHYQRLSAPTLTGGHEAPTSWLDQAAPRPR